MLKLSNKNKLLAYIFLGLILVAAIFVRIYRVDQILGFYFDQGRDALVIWDLIHKGKLFLIGPTTGIAGIFRGPYYYYLIAPFYFLGGGNPVWPAVFLALTTVMAVALAYYLGVKISGPVTGFLAAILASFSFALMIAGRWLSNPTPMLLLSMLLVWGMFEVQEGKRVGWPVIALVFGLSLFNFGSSGELFYLSALIIFAAWQWKHRPKAGVFLLSVFLFVLTFLPLIVFDVKHGGILSGNFFRSFGQDKSFAIPTIKVLIDRTSLFLGIFPKLIFHSIDLFEKLSLGVAFITSLVFLPKLIKNPKVKILLLLTMAPITGFYFYQGNNGVVYDYYLTGYFMIFILLTASALGWMWGSALGKTFVSFFVFLFLWNNFFPIRFILNQEALGPGAINLAAQKKALDWIYQDAKDKPFNADVYVPPVISYSYDYLFTWYGRKVYGKVPVENRQPLLYTLYEDDPSHPERLNAWLARQKGIGKAEEESRFGGITVQRRVRL